MRIAERHHAPPVALADADVVLVAVKTYDTVAALQPLRGILRPGVPVVSLQNGLDQVAQASEALGAQRPFALAPTTEAAAGYGDGGAIRHGRGHTRIGWAAGREGSFDLARLVRALRAGDFDAETATPIEPHAWAKLVVNAAINPVTALARRPNGYLAEHPAARALAVALARETAAVAEKSGVVLPFDDVEQYVLEVVRQTAGNRSSMLADVERGRPTEIDAINGAVVRRGRPVGVPTPENARMVDEVRRAVKA
ncbi:MAG: 2-dehydropantoate 2-reductase [Candidatus Eremiobacteraeota bacterium]|nr:2-dehydropantoate 2-reductase [Candidatus Eremiobacteraeota bacterium]